MRNFAQLMHRLLELQSHETQRSPELIAEDERLMDCLHSMDGLQEKNPGRKPPQTAKLSPDGRVGKRLRACQNQSRPNAQPTLPAQNA
jgi:hypothetical protein